MENQVKTAIPVIFRGERRFYKVIGIQDSTFYGISMAVSTRQSITVTVAFAAIGGAVPADGPFSKRSGTVPFLACTQLQPTDQDPPVMVEGYRLDRFDFVVGKNLSTVEAATHLESQIPTLSLWLDGIIEEAGLIPTFNDTKEVFAFFLGQSEQAAGEKIPLDLPEMKAKGGKPLEFDYSKYGMKASTIEEFQKAVASGAKPLPSLLGMPKPKKPTTDQLAAYADYAEECEVSGGQPMPLSQWMAENSHPHDHQHTEHGDGMGPAGDEQDQQDQQDDGSI